MREKRRSARPVSDHFTCLFRRLPQHPRPKILLGILEIEFFGDRDAVVADNGRSPFFFSISTHFKRGPSVTRTTSESSGRRAIFSLARPTRTQRVCRTCSCQSVAFLDAKANMIPRKGTGALIYFSFERETARSLDFPSRRLVSLARALGRRLHQASDAAMAMIQTIFGFGRRPWEGREVRDDSTASPIDARRCARGSGDRIGRARETLLSERQDPDCR